MEVGGKKPDTDLLKSSDRESTRQCEPCGTDGKRLAAEGYCLTCKDYLCEACYKAHTVPKPCRNHVLLDKSQMPHDTSDPKAQVKQSPCTSHCINHPEEIVKFFCQSHNSVLCGVCAVLEHKACDVQYIPDLKCVQSYNESGEYRDLIDRLKALEKGAQVCISDVGKHEPHNDERVKAALDDICKFRREMNAYLDSREETLFITAKRMKEEDQSIRNDLVQNLQTLQLEFQHSRNKLDNLQNGTSDLFVASKQIHKQIPEFEKALQDYAVQNKSPEYVFKRDEYLQGMLSSCSSLWTLERTYKARPSPVSVTQTMTPTLDFNSAQVTKLPDIDMKTPGDKYNPDITGLVFLHPNTLLAVDWNHSSLKSVNTTNNSVTSQLSFTSRPRDITLLPGDQAAVTLPWEKRIQVISTKDQYSCLRSISVSDQCWGICSTNTKIVVSFINSGMIQVMDIAGNVLTSISKDNAGTQLFKEPWYITVSIEETGEMVYVSDCETNRITKLSINGEVLSTYTHENWCGLYGLISVGQGQVLVSNCWRHTVDVVSREGKDVVTLLDKSTHGIHFPLALCYCESQESLYVSNIGGRISVIKVSHK